MDYSYIGSGKVYMEEFGSDNGLEFIGNVTALNFVVNEDTREMKDHTQPGGGTYNEVRRIESVEFSLNMAELSPENLAKAALGANTAVSGGTVDVGTPENVTAKLDKLVPFEHPPTAGTIVVKDETDTTTYVAGTDYDDSPAGIIPKTGGAIVAEDTLHVSYTYGAYDVVQAMVAAGKEFRLYFEGLNEARSGKQVRLDMFRGRPGAANQLDWISDDYAQMEVTGKVLKDTSKSGAGISQYWKADLVQ